MRLSKLVNSERRLEGRFLFRPPVHNAITLDVTLAYIPPTVLADRQQQAQIKVLGRNKSDMLADMERQARDLEEAFYEILAERVVKVDGLTVRKLYSLVAMDDGVGSMGVKLDEPVPTDPGDPTPIDPELRGKWEVPDNVASMGQLGRANVLYLIGHCPVFRQFVLETVQDVSFFQTAPVADEVKN